MFVTLYYVLLEPYFKQKVVDEAHKAWNEASGELKDYLSSEEFYDEDHSLYEIPTSAEYFDNQTSEEDYIIGRRLQNDLRYRELFLREQETFVAFLKTPQKIIENYKTRLIRDLRYIDDPELSNDILNLISN